MLIVCPACASEYDIATDRVGVEGRSVRCAACRETWFISPDEVAAALAEEMAEIQAAMGSVEGRGEAQADLDAWEAALAEEAQAAAVGPVPEEKPVRKPRGRTPPPKRWGAMSPVAAFGLALLAGIPLALLARSTVVRAMPQSAALYAGIGMPVNLRGIEIRDLSAFQTQGEGAASQLVVEGDVVGVAGNPVPVPPIEVEVRDAQDQTIYRWTVAPPRSSLEDRETARFRASLSAPPAQGRTIKVGFAPERGVPETDLGH
ncbi:zinc-ribbon domain-containing protein [Methylobacterium sp. 88A]|uniref:zinc-ribbon domain-containing protein n=1 Tax=Methylobacterium sp. 88A TaxID=1131813 RepID=UPI000372C5FD|nr:zinc-ribbon domain-containing protein [Methylobacterium sp. 88A]